MEAGLIEFGLFGFHGASTKAIAERAGVPQPHVYANFSTKQELFLACVDGALAQLVDAGHAPSFRPDAQQARLVVQAVASSRDPDMGDRLRTMLSAVERELGSESFAAVLLAGMAALRAADSHAG